MNFILDSWSWMDYNIQDVSFSTAASKEFRKRMAEVPPTLDYNEQFLLSSKLKLIKQLATTFGLKYTKTNLRAFITFPHCMFGNILEIKLCKPDKDEPFGLFQLSGSTLTDKDIELSTIPCQTICNYTRNIELTIYDINMGKLRSFLSETREVYDKYESMLEEKQITDSAKDLLAIVTDTQNVFYNYGQKNGQHS